MTKDLKMAIQIYVKTRECHIPELKKYNKDLPENDNENANRVLSQTIWTEEGSDKSVLHYHKAFPFGKNLINVTSEEEE